MRRVLACGLIAAFSCVAAAAGTSGSFSVGQRGHVLVPVSVDGAETKPFVLDTAASQTVLDPGQFPALQRTATPPAAHLHAPQGAHGSVEAMPTGLRSIALWQVEAIDQPAALMRLEQLTRGKVPDFAGVLGLPFLRGYRIDVDYPKKLLTLDEFDNELPPCDICTPDAAITIRPIIAGLPTVTVTINGRSMPALLDTGAANTILNEAAAALLGLSGSADAEQTMDVELALGGEPAMRHAVRRIALPVFTTLRLDAEPAIILGIDYLGRGRMVLDLASNSVWFKAAKESTPVG